MPGPTPSQPGWYPDGEGNQRWFDGNSWTDHVQPGPADDSTVVVPPSGPGTAELPQQGVYGAVPPPPPTPGWNQPGQPPYGQHGYGEQPRKGKGLWIALAVIGVLLLIGIIVAGAFLLLGDDEDDDKGSDETTTSSTPETSSTPPSETPTDDETDDLPTVPESPTDLPTDLTEMPTDFPSELFSDFPTDPAEWESWFSEYLEELQP